MTEREEEALECLEKLFGPSKRNDYAENKFMQRISDSMDIEGVKNPFTPTLLEIAKSTRKYEEL